MSEKKLKGGQVILNAEEYLAILDRLHALEDELRRLGHKGFTTSETTTRPPTPERRWRSEKASEGSPFELRGFDINAISWKTKGGEPAGPESSWCWAFGMSREGLILDEARPLIEAIERYGPEVVVGDYILKLSGRDGNLLSRRKVKK